MAFAYDSALLATIGLTSWVALDIALDPARRRRLRCVAVLALAALAWSVGELFVGMAQAPDEVLRARRILFAGVCTLPAAWVWSAHAAAWPHRTRRAARLFLALLVPGLLSYACLYVAPGGLFVDWYARPPRHGPVFLVYAAYAWLLIGAGALLLLRAIPRGGGTSQRDELVIVAGVLAPVLANAVHLLAFPAGWDLTPVALGFSAVVFRLIVVDVTWGVYHTPIARAEMIAQMHDAVLIADLEGRVVDWNGAAAELLEGQELEGRPLGELVAGAGELRGRELEVRAFRLQRRGRWFGTGAIAIDRTEQRRAEIRREMATRIEALGYLAAGAAHEINNPLTYVFANLELLAPLVSTLEAARAREAALLVADAQEGATRIHSIVKTLARVARAGETDQAAGALDVRAAVERAVAMACLGQPEREVPISVDGPLPPVRAAETDVVHIVFHLMVNAVQIGGDQVAISIELRSAGNEVAVRVSDDGPGIHESDLPHVFEPFYTTRRPGAHLGLGLSLCWELARRNGGHLDAENRSEGGAAFTLWLPVAKTAHSDRTPERGAT